jgi:hypothetical protein
MAVDMGDMLAGVGGRGKTRGVTFP